MKKEEVLRAYEEQKASCIAVFPTLTSSWTYFVQLEKAIDSYFSNADSVSDSVRAVIRGAYVSQTKAALKCKDDEKYGIEYNADVGSIDLTPYWYAWEWLKENLADKIRYTTSEASTQAEGSAGEKIIDAEQPELDAIVKDISAARVTEAAHINDYAESFWQGNSKMDFICLVEDRGNVVKTPDKKAIVKKLYLDCGLLTQIQENGLDVYVPSYIGGDASA
jgi:hypothetical protein|nr:MAG TPA: hypothetical protein [Caudoviricetes sp.]